MDDRVIKRGEVYWLESDSYGVEQKLGRPIVVVSSDIGNEKSNHVIGLFATTKPKYGVLNVELHMPRKSCWVQCNYPATVYQDKLTNYVYTLTESEMQEVEKGIRVALSLNRCDSDPDAWEDERRELEEEIASLKAQQCRRSEDTTDIIVERDMWKKMYEKALEMLVTKNINTASEAVVVEEPKPKTEPRVEFVTEPEVTADINTASEAELRKCGCTPDMSRRIIENRPYKAVDDLKRFDWMTRIGFQIVKNRLTCEVVVEEPPKQDKININIVSAKELDEAIHCGMTSAYSITGYRKKNGDFTDLEKLREVKYVPKNFLEKYGEKLTV